MTAKLHLVESAPTADLVTVTRGGRRTSAELGRDREHLTPEEVEKLANAAKKHRYGARDWLMIMLAYRHGLRASELVSLRRDSINFESGDLYVKRSKGGNPSTQPLQGEIIRALRKLFRETPTSPFVFLSERGAPLTRAGFQRLVERAGVAAGFSFGVHPHMLRHACGYKLAKDDRPTRSIQQYLGHKSIASTVRYTALSSTAFKDFW